MAVYQFVALAFLVGVVVSCSMVEGHGVNWGMISTPLLPFETTVNLLKDNGMNKVKLFHVDDAALKAFAGTGIEVTIAMENDMLQFMTDYNVAKEWVKKNVTAYISNKVNIKYVGIGNEPFLKDYEDKFTNVTFPALKNIQQALNEAGVGDKIKATIPLNADVYYSPASKPGPSGGQFRDDVSDIMAQIVEFYNQSGAPFMVNIYPFLSLFYGNGTFPVDYAFFDGTKSPVIDNGNTYTNMFDANLDTLITAMKKLDCGDVPVVIGEIGWPTDGDPNANVTMAKNFYSGFVKHLASNAGTPLRPNTSFEVFFFSLMDENEKSILPGNFERSWGIFDYAGQPKFALDLSGKGQKNSLVGAKDVEFLPKRWCVVSPTADPSGFEDAMKYACDRADCTAIGYGSSCGSFDAGVKASYALNMYFQAQNQKKGSCGFQGLAMETDKDPSRGTCKFIVQINSTDVLVVPQTVAVAPSSSSPRASPSPSHSSSSSTHASSPSSSSPALRRVVSYVSAAVGLAGLYLF